MQLFIQNFRIQQNNIHLDDKDCIKQMRTVLRMKTGDTICIQTPQPENNIYTRHTVTITQLTNDTLIGAIQSTQEHQYRPSKLHMRIAMPNKTAKGELIVQKLSEIGIEHIHFRPAERSVVKTENANKMQRLRLIASEAVEQSWGWIVPNITLEGRINNASLHKDKLKIFFDMKQFSSNIQHLEINNLSEYIKEKNQTYDDVIAVI